MSLNLGAPQTWEDVEQSFAQLQKWLDRGVVDTRGYSRFETQPRCRFTIPSAQTIANNTQTAVTWSSASIGGEPELEYDNGALHGQAFLPGNSSLVIIPPRPGIYHVQAQIGWAANATGYREVGLLARYPAGDVTIGINTIAAAPTVGTHQSCSGMVVVETPTSATVNWPRVYVLVIQTSGGNLDINSSARLTWIQIVKVA